MNNVYELATFLINYCAKKGRPISNLQLQKILYFIQGFSWNEFGKPCFRAEFQAWQYGPVIEDLYHRYKIYGASPIPSNLFYDCGSAQLERKRDIERWADALSAVPAWELMEISHQTTPWAENYTLEEKGVVIPSDQIRKYFTEGN